MWQGLAAGVVSGGVAALFVTVSGNGSVALLVKSAWVRDWLYHGQHVTASAVYGRELFASQNVGAYALLLIGFPIIGLVMGLIGTACANPVHSLPDSGGSGGSGGNGGPGPDGPLPRPAPPGGGRYFDTEDLIVLMGEVDAEVAAL